MTSKMSLKHEQVILGDPSNYKGSTKGLFGSQPQFAKPKFGKVWQPQSVVKKLEAKLWQKLARELTLWQVGHTINEVWQTTNVAKTKHKSNNLWLPKFGLANYGWEPNKPEVSTEATLVKYKRPEYTTHQAACLG
jgi:hypothetical protein